MRNYLIVSILSILPMLAPAMRHIGLETDALNRVFPVSYTKNIAFSPASFEIDCALVAESLPTIPKAKVTERLGVVLDLQSSYRPLLDAFAVGTNGCFFASARGFCVGDVLVAQRSHRLFLESVYNAEILRQQPKAGAENWFKAMMDGEMEDFELPNVALDAKGYAFYDLVSVSVSWQEPFPCANTRKLQFIRADGERVPMDFMADARNVEAWENSDFTLIRLPLKGNAFFYAMMPRDPNDFSAVRKAISSDRIDQLLVVTKSLTEPGVYVGAAAVVLPKLDIRSRLNMMSVMAYFQIPLTGLTAIDANANAREMKQWTNFRLAEQGRGEPSLAKKPADKEVHLGSDAKKFVFNQPFLYFVYHEPTLTIPVAGQFTGKD